MGIYSQARRVALGVLCMASVVAGVCMTAAPGSALATVCVTGSGSSLQGEQQGLWTGLFSPTCGSVEYTSTSSGKGLTEFGIQENKSSKYELTVSESGKGTFDGFVGTDDPPTLAALKETESGSRKADTVAWTTPVVAAPVAVIMHMPKGCEFLDPELTWSVEDLNDLVLGLLTVKEFGELAKVVIMEVDPGDCEVDPIMEVRSDSSGTSFAFKQFLCQYDASWGGGSPGECESGENFVSDSATWPSETKAQTEHTESSKKVLNEGSKGEANAVKETEGSIGYVNLANAVADGFTKYGDGGGSGESDTMFWAKLEEGSSGSAFAEPVRSSREGNCPTSYTFPTGVETEAKEGMWAKVHLAKVGQTGAYPLCTLTYDVAWQNYETAELEKEYGSKAKAKEIGGGTKEYLKYAVGKHEGQENIGEYYSPLPENIQEISTEIVENHVG